ncbi:hypothetical protein LXL04_007229 [Taraxacum kok-saghyz]
MNNSSKRSETAAGRKMYQNAPAHTTKPQNDQNHPEHQYEKEHSSKKSSQADPEITAAQTTHEKYQNAPDTNETTAICAPDRRLVCKLKKLKHDIRSWRSSIRASEVNEYDTLCSKIDDLEVAAESIVLSTPERSTRRDWKQRIAELDSLKKMDLMQKAKIKWDIDGDENNSFFHGIINGNKRFNQINGLIIDGEWCINLDATKKEVWSFFKNKFDEPFLVRPKLINNNFRKLDS